MERHFHEQLVELKQVLLRMGLLVEEAIRRSMEALVARDKEKANQVLQKEDEINRLEISIDQKALSLLALEQPVAIDLRRIVMIIKINNDLERMGDHAVNIAQRAIRLKDAPDPQIMEYLKKMSKAAQEMVRGALDAFIQEDTELARRVLNQDDIVDTLNDDVYFKSKKFMEDNPANVELGFCFSLVAYNLERVADLASNIAEDVIYIKQGKEVRHHADEAPDQKI